MTAPPPGCVNSVLPKNSNELTNPASAPKKSIAIGLGTGTPNADPERSGPAGRSGLGGGVQFSAMGRQLRVDEALLPGEHELADGFAHEIRLTRNRELLPVGTAQDRDRFDLHLHVLTDSCRSAE